MVRPIITQEQDTKLNGLGSILSQAHGTIDSGYAGFPTLRRIWAQLSLNL